MKNLIAALFAVLVLTLPPVSADAQPSPREQAAALAEQATVAFEEERLDDAIAAYTEGFSLVPDPSFAYNLGGLHMMDENLGQALRYFEAYLRLFPGATDRADVESLIEELRSELTATWTQLSVESVPAGATVITVDADGQSEELGQTPLEAYVRPGETRLRVQLEGWEDAEDLFNGVPGILVPLSFTLTEVPQAEPEAPVAEQTPESTDATETSEPAPALIASVEESRPNVAGWAVLGAGAVSAGVGVVFLLGGQSAEDDHNTLAASIAPGVNVSQTELDDLSSRARSQTAVGLALTGVGVVGIATGTWLLARGDRDASTSAGVTTFSILPTRRGAALSLGGRF